MHISNKDVLDLKGLRDRISSDPDAMPPEVIVATLDKVLDEISMSGDQTSIALNEMVTVTLNDRGQQILAQEWDKVSYQIPSLTVLKPDMQSGTPHRINRQQTMPLWLLMTIIGPHLGNDKPSPIEGVIELHTPKKTSKEIVKNFRSSLKEIKEMLTEMGYNPSNRS